MLVSKGDFLSYQQLFYSKVQATPYKLRLETVTVVESSSFSLDAFVGDSDRTSVFHEFRCLYEKEISPRTREKYGLPLQVNGVVYLSPLQLVPVYGDYHLDWNTTRVHFTNRVQVIDRIDYLEEFKEYGTCLALQIFLKDSLKGG